MPASVIQARRAEYAVLQAALPGRTVVNAGLLLLDPAGDRLYARLREDWEELAEPEDAEVLARVAEDLRARAEEMGGAALLGLLEDRLSNVLRLTPRESAIAADFARALERLFARHVAGEREPAEIRPYVTHLPRYSLRAAAGKFGDDIEVEPEGWMRAPQGLRLDDRMFAGQVVGRSMEPKIPDGALCVFRAGVEGSRQGKILLVERFATSEHGGEFTVKRYHSEKTVTEEGWRHERIVLEPLNPEFEAWDLGHAEFRVIAEFLRVLPIEEQ